MRLKFKNWKSRGELMELRVICCGKMEKNLSGVGLSISAVVTCFGVNEIYSLVAVMYKVLRIMLG